MCGAGMMMMMVFIPHSVGFPLEPKRSVCFTGYEQFAVVLFSFHKISLYFCSLVFSIPKFIV